MPPAIEVQREDPFDMRLLERTVLDHEPVAGAPFLAGLKAKDDRSGDRVAPAAQGLRGTEQDAHVTVVAAGMHHPRILRAISRRTELLDRQRIHIRAQQGDRSGLPPAQRRKQPGLPDVRANTIERQRLQMFEHVGRRREFAHRKFGSCVQVAAHRDECFFHDIKRFRAIASRYDKTARNFLATVELACAWRWLI